MENQSQQNVTVGKKNVPEPHIPVDNEFPILKEIVELPSKGAFYPEGKSSVTIKGLTAEEDDILFSSDYLKNNRVLDVLIDTLVLDKDLRPDDMLAGDRDYIYIQIRKTGFGPIYKSGIPRKCKSCELEYEPVADLDKLKIKYLEVAPDQQGEYSVMLPTTKMNIKFRPLRGSDAKKLTKIIESNSKTKSGMKVSGLMTERYLMQIMEVNGNRDKLYIRKFIKAMPTMDSVFFRFHTSNMAPGIDLNYEYECPECGAIEEDEIVINQKLFYPDQENGEPAKS